MPVKQSIMSPITFLHETDIACLETVLPRAVAPNTEIAGFPISGMNLFHQLVKIQEESRLALNAEESKLIERAIDDLTGLTLRLKAIYVGDRVPDFKFSDARGDLLSFHESLSRRPAIVIFYRGGWCPYCSVTLRAYEEIFPKIVEAGGQVIGISLEKPAVTQATAHENRLHFPLLSDVKGDITNAFGLLHDLPDYLIPLFTKQRIDLTEINGPGNWSLPIPATYVVNSRQRVVGAKLDADHRRRMEPEEALTLLTQKAFTGIG
jgi:peroxiredoxin